MMSYRRRYDVMIALTSVRRYFVVMCSLSYLKTPESCQTETSGTTRESPFCQLCQCKRKQVTEFARGVKIKVVLKALLVRDTRKCYIPPTAFSRSPGSLVGYALAC